MSTFKMTFSLASLVILMMFIAMPVMAHPERADDPDTLNDDETIGLHQHPSITVTIADANRNTTDAIEVVDTDADDADEENSPSPTIQFDVTLTVPLGARDGSPTTEVTDGTFTPVMVSAYDPDYLPVGAMTAFGDWARADATMKPREWTATVTITLADVSVGADDAAARVAAIEAAITAGLTVKVDIPADLIQTTGLVGGLMEDQSNLASTTTVTVIAMAVDEKMDDSTPVEFEVSGTPSLTSPFTVTFTSVSKDADGDLIGAVLMKDDIDVDISEGFVVIGTLSDAASPSDAPMTVWKAIVQPVAGAKQISVTIKVNTDRAPAAAEMNGILRITGITLVSITAAEGADDTAPFVVTLTFSDSVEALDPEDIMVSPYDDPDDDTDDDEDKAEVSDVNAVSGTDMKEWTAVITPVEDEETTVALADDSGVGMGSVTALKVAVKGAPPPGVPTPGTRIPDSAAFTAAEAAGVVTLSLTETAPLPANGFGVLYTHNPSLPDIQRFFAEGGTISVLSSDTDAKLRDVVISEIMWGLNLRTIGAARSAHQFIELYDTTGGAVDLTKLQIVFDGANTVPEVPTGMVFLDEVSNVSGIGWVISAAPGSSGRTTLPNDTTFVPSDLVSMYRKIDYAKVEKTDHDKDAAKNRKAQLNDFPNGNALGSWAASNSNDTYDVNLIGSPGEKHFVAYGVLIQSPIDRSLVIINEIGNHGGDNEYDWVELRNVSSGEVNLKNWELSLVTDDKKDTQLVSFPDNDDHKIAAGDVLLLVNSDPYRDPSHPLAAGTRINGAKAETTGLKDESRYYVDGGLILKDGDTLLILRSANNKEGKPEAFKDVVGTLSIVDNAASLRTSLWPLRATSAPDKNVVDGDKDNKQDDFRSGRVYRRGDASGGTGEKDLARVGYTGVGYKRSAAKSNQNGGTPGYPNNAVIDTDTLADAASVTISEVMYARGRNLPQWIELYNSSTTQAVNLNEWKLKLESADDVDIRTSVTTNNLGGTIIPPNQTVLIVSSTTGRVSRAAQSGVDFPASRVINMWGQKDKLEVATGLTRRTYSMLSQIAFKITLIAKGGGTVDVAGNLGADGTAMWELPTAEEGEGRSSIIRRYDAGEARDGTLAPPGDGTGAWVLAAMSSLSEVRFNETFYGSPDDVGTPGYHGGGALPVSLSKFRPERLDSGAVVVRWITESELNNAGFNILRSETRDGEFTKLNTKLIAGQGTTSERTVYEFPDTSAKPNVVYYYQIQDVSLDGKVQTLRQSRIKGNVTAAGKATTTWGELKALQ